MIVSETYGGKHSRKVVPE